MLVLLIVTIVSVLVAILMTVVAWRVGREERLRAEARISALAADIHGVRTVPPAIDLDLRPAPRGALPDLFASAQTPPSGGLVSRWGLSLAIGALVIASVAAFGVVFGGESPTAATMPAPAHAAQAAPAAQVAPLELVALGHERDGKQLTVRGVVRNPSGRSDVDGLTAVVFLFDSNGNFVTSGRAGVVPAVAPGGESTFAVTVADAGDVSRYRVSFRAGDRVVPHVDRRNKS